MFLRLFYISGFFKLPRTLHTVFGKKYAKPDTCLGMPDSFCISFVVEDVSRTPVPPLEFVYFSCRRGKKMPAVECPARLWGCRLAMVLCLVVYVVVGFMGYARFGAATKGDILTNYARALAFAWPVLCTAVPRPPLILCADPSIVQRVILRVVPRIELCVKVRQTRPS